MIALKCPPKVIKEFEEFKSTADSTTSLSNPKGTILEWGFERNVFNKLTDKIKGAQVFKAKTNLGDYIKKGYYYHLDTFHSKGRHIEFYNSKGIHQGTLSLDGKILTDEAVKGRRLILN